MIRILLYLLLLVTLSGCNSNNVIDDKLDTASDPEVSAQNIIPELEKQAKTAYMAQDWNLAETKYYRLIELKSDQSEYWLYLGNIYASTNRAEAAINAYRQSLNRDSSNIKAWNNMGVMQLRQATMTFINMQNQLDENDPLNYRINTVVKKISDLMENEFTEVTIQ